MKMTTIWIILAFSLSGCGSIATTPALPLPEQPIYPKLTPDEVKAAGCLPIEVRKKLILRDKLKSDHIVELENIIRSTQ